MSAAAARAWRALTPRQIRARALRIGRARSLFDTGPDLRSTDEIEAAQLAHAAKYESDEDYRRWCNLCVEIAHAPTEIQPEVRRVVATYAASDDPAVRAKAVSIIRELLDRAAAREGVQS